MKVPTPSKRMPGYIPKSGAELMCNQRESRCSLSILISKEAREILGRKACDAKMSMARFLDQVIKDLE